MVNMKSFTCKIARCVLYVGLWLALVKCNRNCHVSISASNDKEGTTAYLNCTVTFAADISKTYAGLILNGASNTKQGALDVNSEGHMTLSNWLLHQTTHKRWKAFNLTNNHGYFRTLTFGLYHPNVHCHSQISGTCWCKNALDVLQTVTGKILVHKKAKLAFSWMTPLDWSKGAVIGTFAGARCVAVEDYHSNGYLQWSFRSKSTSNIGLISQMDKRVQLASQTTLYEPAPDNDTFLSSGCRYDALTTSISFKMGLSYEDVMLTCKLLNVSRGLLDAHGDNIQRDLQVTTEPLKLLVPVDCDNSMVTYIPEHSIITCDSVAKPPANYSWSVVERPELSIDAKAVMSNTWGGSMLNMTTVGVAGWQRLTWICTAKNRVSGKDYACEVSKESSASKTRETVETAESKMKWSRDVYALAMNAAVSLGSVMGLFLLVWMLMSEQRTRTKLEELGMASHRHMQADDMRNSRSEQSLTMSKASCGTIAP